MIRSSKINLLRLRVKLVGDATPAERHVCPYCGFYSRQFRFFCVPADAARSEALQTIAPVINSFFLCLSEEQLEEDKLHSNGGKVSSSPPPLTPTTPTTHLSRLLTSRIWSSSFSFSREFSPKNWLVARAATTRAAACSHSRRLHPFLHSCLVCFHVSIFVRADNGSTAR